MSITIRKQLSVMAWVASLFCCAMLLFSAFAAAAHKQHDAQVSGNAKPAYAAPN